MIRIGDKPHEVTSATLEIFHLFAEEPGWTFEATLAGTSGKVAFEGRVRMPALVGPARQHSLRRSISGPSVLQLLYIDSPRVITVDGTHGSLDVTSAAELSCTAIDLARVRILGTLQLTWTALARSERATQVYPIEIGVDAALIT